MDTRSVISRIERLKPKEKVHIFSLLKKNGVDATKNSNGYFFNLGGLAQDTATELVECLELIEKNRDIISELDKRRETTLAYYQQLFAEKLQATVEKQRQEYLRTLAVHTDYVNVMCNVCRKYRFYNPATADLDPDALMREAAKKVVYPKGSPYHRLMCRMRALKRGIASDDHNHTTEGDDVSVNLEDASVEIEDHEGASVHSGGDADGDSGEDDVDVDPDAEAEQVDIELEPEDIRLIDDVSQGDEEDVGLERSEDDNEDDLEEAQDEIDKKREEDLRYFRQLLHQHGFQFKENSECLLLHQDYIR